MMSPNVCAWFSDISHEAKRLGFTLPSSGEGDCLRWLLDAGVDSMQERAKAMCDHPVATVVGFHLPYGHFDDNEHYPIHARERRSLEYERTIEKLAVAAPLAFEPFGLYAYHGCPWRFQESDTKTMLQQPSWCLHPFLGSADWCNAFDACNNMHPKRPEASHLNESINDTSKRTGIEAYPLHYVPKGVPGAGLIRKRKLTYHLNPRIDFFCRIEDYQHLRANNMIGDGLHVHPGDVAGRIFIIQSWNGVHQVTRGHVIELAEIMSYGFSLAIAPPWRHQGNNYPVRASELWEMSRAIAKQRMTLTLRPTSPTPPATVDGPAGAAQ